MNTIILAGGTGTMGRILQEHFVRQGNRVVVLTRDPGHHHRPGVAFLPWDGRTLGPWASELEGARAVINLAGRSVDSRYTARNRALILRSRVDATRVLGEAVRQCTVPPALWINMSTATIYRHAEDRAMDEATGEIGSGFSVDVAQRWERSFFEQHRPGVRQVAVRCAMVFSPYGGAFPRFAQLTRMGLGGRHGSGDQYMSWVHEADVSRFFQWLVDTPEVHGIINLSAPAPVRDHVLLSDLRRHIKPVVALPTPEWMLGIGAFFLRTETELVLKSRRVVPTRAVQLGFTFQYPTITSALDELFARSAQH
jgi:uncharacterized protein (TIGR01777 family)